MKSKENGSDPKNPSLAGVYGKNAQRTNGVRRTNLQGLQITIEIYRVGLCQFQNTIGILRGFEGNQRKTKGHY